MKSPVEILVAIVTRSKSEYVREVLSHHKVNNELTLMGKGTAKNTLGDIFSFGIIDRDLICAFVSTDLSVKICEDIYSNLSKEKGDGIVFTMPIDAISSDLYSQLMGV